MNRSLVTKEPYEHKHSLPPPVLEGIRSPGSTAEDGYKQIFLKLVVFGIYSAIKRNIICSIYSRDGKRHIVCSIHIRAFQSDRPTPEALAFQVSPQELKAVPKAERKEESTKIRRGKTVILTSSPYKEELISSMESGKTAKRKLQMEPNATKSTAT
ncbi:hypothetical protein ANN_20612 [Periplaneta americana]|uniref:Uncharacterized protein n=1 Tax=Periplaneta americana TaxID=6978 RepID=A0ABQ8SD23_PERAM|nr:hypothetical protein ANN_20612 [Periplaneta americana]